MFFFFFFQAEDGIRDLVRSRGLGDVYKRQIDGAAGRVGKGDTAWSYRDAKFGEVIAGIDADPALSLIHI